MNIFELVAKIRLDSGEYEQGIDKSRESFSKLASGVGKGVATVAKVGAAAVAAGAAGVAALTKMGVDGYAQYEQLAGGVETLFKDSQATVMQYAANAYKTAGMSANQYMQTVTSFSASLIQSLDGDTAKAAEVGNMAITDMSDNANKMGTSMEMIQNAYQGFSKQNYTMLDNLKLGYGGTKTEMERLLKDAEKISGIKYDISSYSDVVTAIHVIQEEMGIAGTTAQEASGTIEGSVSSMKAAWENLVVGMADGNADMGGLITDFVDSTAAAAENLLPRIEQTLQGVGSLVERMAPLIAEALPRLVESVLPSLLSAGIELIGGLASGIVAATPAIYQAFLDAIYMVLTDVFGMSEESANGFVGTIDGIIQDLVGLFQAIPVALNWLVEQATTEGTAFNMIWENIQKVVSAAVSFIQGVIKLFTAILTGDWSAAWDAVKTIASSTWDAIVGVIDMALATLGGFLTTMVAKGFELIGALVTGIANKFIEFATLLPGYVNENVIDPIVNMGADLFEAGKELLNNFWEGLKSVWDSVKKWWDGLTFSKKSAPIDTDGTPHATGLNFVPFDGYPAILHRGEAVLTAAEARIWRRDGLGGATPALAGGGVVINQYIQSVPQTPVEFASATEAYFEQARWAL